MLKKITFGDLFIVSIFLVQNIEARLFKEPIEKLEDTTLEPWSLKLKAQSSDETTNAVPAR